MRFKPNLPGNIPLPWSHSAQSVACLFSSAEGFMVIVVMLSCPQLLLNEPAAAEPEQVASCAHIVSCVSAGPKLSKHQALQEAHTLTPVSRLASDLCLPHWHQMGLQHL